MPRSALSRWARPVVVHSASPCSRVVQKVQGGGGDLDSEPFALALGDVDGVELAALDLVQHGLAGAAQHPGGVLERQVVGGTSATKRARTSSVRRMLQAAPAVTCSPS